MSIKFINRLVRFIVFRKALWYIFVLITFLRVRISMRATPLFSPPKNPL